MVNTLEKNPFIKRKVFCYFFCFFFFNDLFCSFLTRGEVKVEELLVPVQARLVLPLKTSHRTPYHSP